MRELPDPDPIARHAAEEGCPAAMLRGPHQSRALRLRYFLVGRCAGLGEPLAWHLALTADETELWGIVDQWPDDRLERAIADAARRRAAGIAIEYPFVG